MNSHQHNHDANRNGGFRIPTKWVLFGFAAIAAFFLLAEHRAHAIQYLPWLLLLACPLMHVFMHRGHHGHHGRQGPTDDPRAPDAPAPRDHPGVSP